MSRIGKKPIAIPAGIEVTANGSLISVKKGNNVSTVETHGRVGIEIVDGQVVLTRNGESKESSAFWGTYRALTANAINGLNEGFSKSLEINGVGYKAAVAGNVLKLALGYSHDVDYPIPAGISITAPKPTEIVVVGIDKQKVGQTAAEIRDFRSPEPYQGKGVKYAGEFIFRKEGKKK
jgi:large subunit ribosomal protein L6